MHAKFWWRKQPLGRRRQRRKKLSKTIAQGLVTSGDKATTELVSEVYLVDPVIEGILFRRLCII
jgi:hypothetical protein